MLLKVPAALPFVLFLQFSTTLVEKLFNNVKSTSFTNGQFLFWDMKQSCAHIFNPNPMPTDYRQTKTFFFYLEYVLSLISTEHLTTKMQTETQLFTWQRRRRTWTWFRHCVKLGLILMPGTIAVAQASMHDNPVCFRSFASYQNLKTQFSLHNCPFWNACHNL